MIPVTLELPEYYLKEKLRELLKEIEQENKDSEVVLNQKQSYNLIGCGFSYFKTIFKKGKIKAINDKGTQFYKKDVLEYADEYRKWKN